MSIRHDFALEAFADFPDDAIGAPVPITAEHIDAMMQQLVECGVKRVSWEAYGDGHGGFLIPDHDPKWKIWLRLTRCWARIHLALLLKLPGGMGWKSMRILNHMRPDLRPPPQSSQAPNACIPNEPRLPVAALDKRRPDR